MTEPILQVREIHKRFPGVHALRGVDFEVKPGEIHALLGENGAGKSTLIKVIAGVHSPESGTVHFDGKSVKFSNPREAQEAGVATMCCVESVVLWNPIDPGYAATYVLHAVVDGEFAPGDTSVMAGRLGELQVVNGSEVLLGAPFIFNAENINDFDF